MPDLTWDKGRTSVLSGTSFWNFGDVLAKDGLKDGFSMGAAFYSTKANILQVDTKDIKNVNGWDFAKAHSSDPPPQGNTPFWGMDTSNVAEVSPGVGVGFVVRTELDPLLQCLEKDLLSKNSFDEKGLESLRIFNPSRVHS